MEIHELRIDEEVCIGDFLKPISEEQPTGVSLKETPVYAEIQEARAADDPNLPRGVWEHDLKRSDWAKVSQLTQSVLMNKSKDLQVAIWFLEAQVYLYGLEKLPVCFLLLSELTNEFWDDIHPRMEDQDVEYRTNVFAWMNDKLPFVIRQIRLAESVSGEVYTWTDWERALHLQRGGAESSKGVQQGELGAIKQAVDQTNIDFYRELWQDISDALIGLDYLSDVLGNRLGRDAPSLSALVELLKVQRDTIEDMTGGRSLTEAADTQLDVAGISDDTNGLSERPLVQETDVADRQRAYAQLAEAAEFLMRDDPHSPVPHLVYKAIEWGRLSTSELYHEIFIRNEGNLNIFDVLGIDRTGGH